MPNVDLTCQVCCAPFSVPQYRADTARFCSRECKGSSIAARFLNKGPKPWAAKNLEGHRHKSPTKFKAGHATWNKDMKGIHLSPASEFKPGHAPTVHLPVGSVVQRTRKREGYPRAWVKVAEPNKWELLARIVWAKHNGPIPRGMIVHHKDRNAINDEIGNLQMMTKAEHVRKRFLWRPVSVPSLKVVSLAPAVSSGGFYLPVAANPIRRIRQTRIEPAQPRHHLQAIAQNQALVADVFLLNYRHAPMPFFCKSARRLKRPHGTFRLSAFVAWCRPSCG